MSIHACAFEKDDAFENVHLKKDDDGHVVVTVETNVGGFLTSTVKRVSELLKDTFFTSKFQGLFHPPEERERR